MISAETFTALTYGLLTIVVVLYLVLVRAFFSKDEDEDDRTQDLREGSA